uniref:NPH3 domain-containing protein n=1 Tax=Chenopodium quinoa TaxID=63459 RepID=A0A803MP41_CHEQI
MAEAVEGEEGSVISLSDLPGGAKMFELVAKFCYGVKLELTSSNVVYLRCAAEHLKMTEEYGEGNLIFQTETFLTQVVLKSWQESLRALQTCDDILSFADQLDITKRCIEALAVKASTDPNLFGWPVVERGGPMQSPEVAPDIDLKLPKFQALAGAVPEFARPLDDGLYRAIDIYLKSHPWLSEEEREQLCRLMDCQKLSLEACTHAAQNERLPLRIVVQVLFFEQLQLRNSIAGCFLVSENLEGSRQLRSGVIGSYEGGWATTVKENPVLKVGMDNMRMRVSELEQECTNMRNEVEKLG